MCVTILAQNFSDSPTEGHGTALIGFTAQVEIKGISHTERGIKTEPERSTIYPHMCRFSLGPCRLQLCRLLSLSTLVTFAQQVTIPRNSNKEDDHKKVKVNKLVGSWTAYEWNQTENYTQQYKCMWITENLFQMHTLKSINISIKSWHSGSRSTMAVFVFICVYA